MKKKKYRIVVEVFKYLIGGLVGMLSDIGIFIFLTWCCDMNVLIANSIAAVLSTVLNYFLQKVWAFKSKSDAGKSFVRYLSVWLFNYMFTMAYLFLMVERLAFPAGWMKTSTYIFIAVWNYFLYKHYVYEK